MEDAKILKFPAKDQDIKGTMKLLKLSDKFDQIILEQLESGELSVNEVAGILSHRLGSLIRLSEQKETLFSLCRSVIEKQMNSDSN